MTLFQVSLWIELDTYSCSIRIVSTSSAKCKNAFSSDEKFRNPSSLTVSQMAK